MCTRAGLVQLLHLLMPEDAEARRKHSKCSRRVLQSQEDRTGEHRKCVEGCTA